MLLCSYREEDTYYFKPCNRGKHIFEVYSTNLAFLLCSVPSRRNLDLNIHFNSMGFFPSGSMVRVQVLFHGGLPLLRLTSIFKWPRVSYCKGEWVWVIKFMQNCKVLYFTLWFTSESSMDDELLPCNNCGVFWTSSNMSSSLWSMSSSKVDEIWEEPTVFSHFHAFFSWNNTSLLTVTLLVKGLSSLYPCDCPL